MPDTQVRLTSVLAAPAWLLEDTDEFGGAVFADIASGRYEVAVGDLPPAGYVWYPGPVEIDVTTADVVVDTFELVEE